jgi:hypothetical protein
MVTAMPVRSGEPTPQLLHENVIKRERQIKREKENNNNDFHAEIMKSR